MTKTKYEEEQRYVRNRRDYWIEQIKSLEPSTRKWEEVCDYIWQWHSQLLDNKVKHLREQKEAKCQTRYSRQSGW